jgi:hypothetical protein
MAEIPIITREIAGLFREKAMRDPRVLRKDGVKLVQHTVWPDGKDRFCFSDIYQFKRSIVRMSDTKDDVVSMWIHGELNNTEGYVGIREYIGETVNKDLEERR